MFRLVVTASGTGPIEARIATYIAKSVSPIMVGPEIVPPGRSELSLNARRTPAAAVPGILDHVAKLGGSHLREFALQQLARPARPT